MNLYIKQPMEYKSLDILFTPLGRLPAYFFLGAIDSICIGLVIPLKLHLSSLSSQRKRYVHEFKHETAHGK